MVPGGPAKSIHAEPPRRTTPRSPCARRDLGVTTGRPSSRSTLVAHPPQHASGIAGGSRVAPAEPRSPSSTSSPPRIVRSPRSFDSVVASTTLPSAASIATDQREVVLPRGRLGELDVVGDHAGPSAAIRSTAWAWTRRGNGQRRLSSWKVSSSTCDDDEVVGRLLVARTSKRVSTVSSSRSRNASAKYASTQRALRIAPSPRNISARSCRPDRRIIHPPGGQSGTAPGRGTSGPPPPPRRGCWLRPCASRGPCRG